MGKGVLDTAADIVHSGLHMVGAAVQGVNEADLLPDLPMHSLCLRVHASDVHLNSVQLLVLPCKARVLLLQKLLHAMRSDGLLPVCQWIANLSVMLSRVWQLGCNNSIFIYLLLCTYISSCAVTSKRKSVTEHNRKIRKQG